jgi:hypothetical protein
MLRRSDAASSVTRTTENFPDRPVTGELASIRLPYRMMDAGDLHVIEAVLMPLACEGNECLGGTILLVFGQCTDLLNRFLKQFRHEAEYITETV